MNYEHRVNYEHLTGVKLPNREILSLLAEIKDCTKGATRRIKRNMKKINSESTRIIDIQWYIKRINECATILEASELMYNEYPVCVEDAEMDRIEKEKYRKEMGWD